MKLYKKFIKQSLFIFSLALTFSACVNKDEFFELRDRNGLDAAIWSTEGAVEMHLARAYDVIMPRFGYDQLNSNVMQGRWGYHWASDENCLPVADQRAAEALGMTNYVITNHDIRFTGNTTTGNFGGNKYMDIARCNNAIKYIPEGTLSPELKRRYLGQYYALRAMVYFELTKVYGGVPLVLEPQDPDNMTISGRASAAECFRTIVRDLDSAMVKLDGVTWNGDTEKGKITRAAAAALKGKVLMYWASPQFNPANIQSRWDVALQANEQALQICKDAGHQLWSDYETIFQTKAPTNKEVIMVRSYSSTIERRGHDEEYKNRPSSEGGSPNNGYRPTLKLLRAYPMKDGNAINESGNYVYNDKLFWKDRDPRFEASIAYNGSVWKLSGKDNRKQWTYNGATGEGSTNWGVYFKRFTSPALPVASVRNTGSTSNIGGSGMDWIEMRFAEVMMNVAECANEANNLGLAKDMVREIRKRAGIEAGNNDYGLGNADKLKMRDLIINERMIEFSMENKRNSDLRRTRRMHLLQNDPYEYSKGMYAIVIEVIGNNNDERKATRDLLEANNFRETLNLNDESVYDQYFQPYSVVQFSAHSMNPLNLYNFPQEHYFYTFHNDFVARGVDIQPTIGWSGGTFDPLAGE